MLQIEANCHFEMGNRRPIIIMFIMSHQEFTYSLLSRVF